MVLKFFMTLIIIFGGIRLYVLNQERFKFYIAGKDKGFKFNEINLLWRLAERSGLEEPSSLYISVPSLNNAIQLFIKQIRDANAEDDPKNQEFLTTIYKYRTKISLDNDNSKGCTSTYDLSVGQKLRIILPGKGVFSSEILSKGREVIVKLPVQKNLYMLPSEEWVGKEINVYLWRQGDAGYVFDTRVVNASVFNGTPAIYLAETDKLIRSQKRRSVRCQCNIMAQMYFMSEDIVDFNVIEREPGFKCLLEDISEDGALIRIGGKAVEGLQFKIQFLIGEKMIVMFGVARAVEFDAKANQSLIHFECLHLENDMRNHVLSFVYNILPDDKKEILEAIAQTEEDGKDDILVAATAPEQNASSLFAKNSEAIDTSAIIDLDESAIQKEPEAESAGESAASAESEEKEAGIEHEANHTSQDSMALQ